MSTAVTVIFIFLIKRREKKQFKRISGIHQLRQQVSTVQATRFTVEY